MSREAPKHTTEDSLGRMKERTYALEAHYLSPSYSSDIFWFCGFGKITCYLTSLIKEWGYQWYLTHKTIMKIKIMHIDYLIQVQV